MTVEPIEAVVARVLNDPVAHHQLPVTVRLAREVERLEKISNELEDYIEELDARHGKVVLERNEALAKLARVQAVVLALELEEPFGDVLPSSLLAAANAKRALQEGDLGGER